MTAIELENELSRLPRLLYFCSLNDLDYKCLILGRYESGPLEEWSSIPITLEHKLEVMLELFDKRQLSEDENRAFVDCYRRILNWCNHLQRTAKEQLRFLEKLNKNQLNEIEQQVKAYQHARLLKRYY